MACSGCERRRQKMRAAYNAVKQGYVSARKSYAAQALNLEHRSDVSKMENVIDLREKQA